MEVTACHAQRTAALYAVVKVLRSIIAPTAAGDYTGSIEVAPTLRYAEPARESAMKNLTISAEASGPVLSV